MKREMRRTIFIGILFLIAAARPAAAHSFLPSSFAEWSAGDSSVVVPPTGLDQTLGSDAPIFHEYFLKSLEQRTYSHGAQTVPIKLYRFRDPSSAYGAYTFFRNESLTPVDLGSYAATSNDRALIVVGDFLLDVTGNPARPSNADLKQLITPLDKVADHTPFPSI
jgi:hypothetical protein